MNKYSFIIHWSLSLTMSFLTLFIVARPLQAVGEPALVFTTDDSLNADTLGADFDNDGDVDTADLQVLSDNFDTTSSTYDLNNNGRVDVFDFTQVLFVISYPPVIPSPTSDPQASPTPTNLPPSPTQADPTVTPEPTPTSGPTVPPTPTPPNINGEIRLLEWNQPALQIHSGFLEAKPAPDYAQGNWVTPANYAEGKLYIRAKVNSIPVNQPGMRLGLCFWQGENNTPSWGEECASAERIEGRAGNEVMWVRDVDNLNPIGGSDNHIDWTTNRWKYGIIVRNGTGDGEGKPVSKKAGMNWNGEDPTHWYPLDIHFTIVVVRKGKAFSGWENYGWPAAD